MHCRGGRELKAEDGAKEKRRGRKAVAIEY